MALGRIAVWPFFAVALIALAVGGVFVVVWWPAAPPAKDGLRKVTGEITTVVIKDDLSGMPGSASAGMQSVYFTLRDVPGEFRYPSVFPRYFEVRDRVSVGVDVWIDPAEEGRGRPLTVWQIQEHNPYNIIGPETFVPYDDVVEALTRVDRSMVRAGTWLLGISVPFLILGGLALRWNRGRPLPMP
ncbi:MAG TPA: hypothetical protein VLA56_21565 [Pseudomonadales bacterium]|nr:hypothetical protein [Pseudomonadales bacterium]